MRKRNSGAALAVAMLMVALVAPSSLVAPASLAAWAPDPAAATQELDFRSALEADGTFVGGEGMTGTVDAGAWGLVGDLSTGEPPRFAPVADAITAGAWSALGSTPGSVFGGAVNSHVRAIAVSGSDLYIGGIFVDVAGIPAADFVARWNGSTWSALPNQSTGGAPITSGSVDALAFVNGFLIAGGNFTNLAGHAAADYVARWSTTQQEWSYIGDGVTAFVNGPVYAIAGSGSRLFVGGFFQNLQGVAAWDFLASWDFLNPGWTVPSPSPSCTVHALAADSTDVYVGGCFQNLSGDATIDRVARWNIDTQIWHGLGSYGGNGSIQGTVLALALSGSDLYVGGEFTDANGDAGADYVARWNGLGWSALGSSALNDRVLAIAVSGSNVYVGGEFTNAGGVATADRVARWGGSAWSGLGSNGSGDGAFVNPVNSDLGVLALGVATEALYAGGQVQNIAGIAEADFVAAYGTGSAVAYRSDGRIRRGTGTLVGNNIYNTDGTNQTRTGGKPRGYTIKFTISIQNDGNATDRFRVAATGAATTMYSVKYFRGTTNITSSVVAGTYQTANLAPTGTFAITVKVKVLSTATLGSSVTRLVSITSQADSSKVDAVKLVGKRK